MKLRLIQIPFAHGDYEPGIDRALKPCPFCGSTDISVSNVTSLAYWAECTNCEAQGPDACGEENQEAEANTVEKTKAAHLAVFNTAIDNWNCRGKTE